MNTVALPKGWTSKSIDLGILVYDPAGELFASFDLASVDAIETTVSRVADRWIARNVESVRRGLAVGAWAKISKEDLKAMGF